MASKNCMWALLAVCGSLLIAAPALTQAADQTEPGAKSKSKPETACRYVESPGSRVKRHVCGAPSQAAENRTPYIVPPTSFGSPSPVVPGMSEFSNPANQSAYKGFR
jgi:hypothetical protein